MQSFISGRGTGTGLSPSPEVSAQDPIGQFFQAHGLRPTLSLQGLRTTGAPCRTPVDRAAQETAGRPEQAGDKAADQDPEAAQTSIDAGPALWLWAAQLGTPRPSYKGCRYGQGTAPRPPGQGAQGPLPSPLRPFGARAAQAPGIGKSRTMAF